MQNMALSVLLIMKKLFFKGQLDIRARNSHIIDYLMPMVVLFDKHLLTLYFGLQSTQSF